MSARVTEGLKLCPFCGSASVGFKDQGLPDTKVGCNDCGAQFPWFEKRKQAIAAWNRRHREQATAELVEALRGLVAAVNTNELAAAMACHSVASFANVKDALKPA